MSQMCMTAVLHGFIGRPNNDEIFGLTHGPTERYLSMEPGNYRTDYFSAKFLSTFRTNSNAMRSLLGNTPKENDIVD